MLTFILKNHSSSEIAQPIYFKYGKYIYGKYNIRTYKIPLGDTTGSTMYLKEIGKHIPK